MLSFIHWESIISLRTNIGPRLGLLSGICLSRVHGSVTRFFSTIILEADYIKCQILRRIASKGIPRTVSYRNNSYSLLKLIHIWSQQSTQKLHLIILKNKMNLKEIIKESVRIGNLGLQLTKSKKFTDYAI